MERSEDDWIVSIGRTSWWVAFVPALYIWVTSLGQEDISSGHLTILIALTTYNFSKKAISAAGEIFKKEDGPG